MAAEKAIVWFEEVSKGDVGLVGGKGANLGELTQELESRGSQLLAVRSSARDEDQEHASFAGVHVSLLGVRPQELPEAVQEVAASSLTARALDGFSPDVVGITAYTVHVKTVRRMFETIKGLDPRVLTIVGGHHATVRPNDFLSDAIDVVVSGEGVEPLR